MQNTPREYRRLKEVEESALSREGGEAVSQYDLTLNVREEAAGLGGAVEYCRDLFTRKSIENLLAQYTGLLEQVAVNARLPIDEYAVVTRWDGGLYREARSSVGGRMVEMEEWAPR